MGNYYKKIRLSRDKTIDEHRYIMQQIVGRELSFNEVVHHIDENKLNNDPGNLKIISRSEHSRMHMNGSACRCEISKCIETGRKFRPRGKLSDNDVRNIRALLSKGEAPKEIASKYSITKDAVYDIKNATTYYWLV